MSYPTDKEAIDYLQPAIETMNAYYKERGIFQDRFGFGDKAGLVVVDFAYGWTDDSYAGGTARLDKPVENTRILIERCRQHNIPIVYTTSPYREDPSEQAFKTAADFSCEFRIWDKRACEIDQRIAPHPDELVIRKNNASAFLGTELESYFKNQQIDTTLITGCSTSACVRATATDAKGLNFHPIVISDCVGDRSATAHVFTLADLPARFADVVTLEETLRYLERAKATD